MKRKTVLIDEDKCDGCGLCVPACAEGAIRIMDGKARLVGCPKLDDASFYREKLAEILAQNEIHEFTVVHMEVPCCCGLVSIAAQAARDAGRPVRLRVVRLGVDGKILDSREMEPVRT